MPMSACLSVRWCAALAALLIMGPVVAPPRAAAAEEEITCAVCGKKVKKSKAIRVIQDGRVYYVCSAECVEKLKKKKK
jgi:YHS domain-containing protein